MVILAVIRDAIFKLVAYEELEIWISLYHSFTKGGLLQQLAPNTLKAVTRELEKLCIFHIAMYMHATQLALNLRPYANPNPN